MLILEGEPTVDCARPRSRRILSIVLVVAMLSAFGAAEAGAVSFFSGDGAATSWVVTRSDPRFGLSSSGLVRSSKGASVYVEAQRVNGSLRPADCGRITANTNSRTWTRMNGRPCGRSWRADLVRPKFGLRFRLCNSSPYGWNRCGAYSEVAEVPRGPIRPSS